MRKQINYFCCKIKKRCFYPEIISKQIQKGQTLLEVLLALAIASLVLGGIILVTSKSLGNTQYSTNQNLATFYAKEGLSKERQKRDSMDWTSFSAYAGGLHTEPPITTSGGVEFTRETVFTNPSPNCNSGGFDGIEVTVTVAWADGACPPSISCHKVELVSCLLDIN